MHHKRSRGLIYGLGIVQAIADKLGREQGFVKNWFDLCAVVVTVVLSLAATGKVIGIGVGTIVAMIGVGWSVSLVNYFFKDKMLKAAGMTAQGKG